MFTLENISLLGKIKQGTSNTKLICWPGTQAKVALRILSQADLQAAAFDTEKLFKGEKIELNMASASEYDSEKTTQILYRALRDPEHLDQPICPTITDFRKSLTKNEKDLLADEYLTFEKDCNPASELLSGDELDRVISDIKKKPDSISQSSYSTSMLKKLIITLASPAIKLPRRNGI